MAEEEIEKKKCKKKFRFFDVYINKALKQVSKNEITTNAKSQLNNLLIILAKLISEKSLELVIIAKKKTLSTKELENSISLLFPGELKKVMIEEGQKSINKFNDKEENKGSSRQNKAGILFPPSVCEKFLRKFGTSNILVTAESPVYMASVLEYFTAELLDLASSISNSNNRVRITVRDLEIAVRTDEEFRTFFNTWNISFLGGGVIPFINPALTNKKKKINQTGLKDIKKYQKQGDCLIFSKHPFEVLIRKIFESYKKDIKISKDFFLTLQYYIEQVMVNLLQKSNNLAIYAGRIKLIPSDIEMVISIEENRLPSFLETKDIEETEFDSTEPNTPMNVNLNEQNNSQ
jgi:histone H2A